jgi:endonuclease-8
VAEGDSILRLARRLGAALGGAVVEARTPGPRRPEGRGAAALDGRTLESAESRGKHLLLRFSGGVVLHSHLGMRGSWHLYRGGERWRKPAAAAWIVLAGDGVEAVNFNGPFLRVASEAELGRDPRLARLGPDVLAPELDPARAVAGLRGTGAATEIGEALLEQSALAGIGNIFKSEGCFAAAVSPWRQLGDLSDEQLGAIVTATRELMLAAVETERQPHAVYRRSGRPCPRCGTRIRAKRQGDSARTTYWCPGCQR